jgi:alkylhydroperoxidase family enzyme
MGIMTRLDGLIERLIAELDDLDEYISRLHDKRAAIAALADDLIETPRLGGSPRLGSPEEENP